MARLQIKQHCLAMFAERQAIGPEIHAVTGGLLAIQLANLNRVGQAASGLDAEIGKNGGVARPR